jgi:hypothetical protein
MTAAVFAIGLGAWSWARNLPGPVTALIALFAFVLGLAAWRAWNMKTDPSMRAFDGKLETKLISHGSAPVTSKTDQDTFQALKTLLSNSVIAHLRFRDQIFKWDTSADTALAKFVRIDAGADNGFLDEDLERLR